MKRVTEALKIGMRMSRTVAISRSIELDDYWVGVLSGEISSTSTSFLADPVINSVTPIKEITSIAVSSLLSPFLNRKYEATAVSKGVIFDTKLT